MSRHKPVSIPTFGIRARAALSCVGGRNVGGYGYNWRVKCWLPYTVLNTCNVTLILINSNQRHQALWLYLLIILPQMKIIFESQQYWVQWYVVIQVISGQEHQLDLTDFICEKTTPWNHTERLRYKFAIPGLCSWHILHHLKCNFT